MNCRLPDQARSRVRSSRTRVATDDGDADNVMQFSSAAEKEAMRMFRFAMVVALCASAVTVGAATGSSDLPERGSAVM